MAQFFGSRGPQGCIQGSMVRTSSSQHDSGAASFGSLLVVPERGLKAIRLKAVWALSRSRILSELAPRCRDQRPKPESDRSLNPKYIARTPSMGPDPRVFMNRPRRDTYTSTPSPKGKGPYRAQIRFLRLELESRTEGPQNHTRGT